MEDHKPTNTTANSSSSSSSSTRERNPSNGNNSEPVRSRWTPKPEQILILESIFNSGMVNPPKEETVRIRKLLEKFGAVGDANVFYWFQNRRSRSRRRQRQLQAAAAAVTTPPPSTTASHPQLYHDYGGSRQHAVSTCTAVSAAGFAPPPNMNCFGGGDVFGGCFSGQMMGVLPHQITQSDSSPPSILGLSHTSNLDFPSGVAVSSRLEP
ncbi:hypothetical protein Cgig2_032141 [Carnegiea gigantea]|uniref:Homeobox domain-containing protein n=1 Tax=Carnegiea gigantea TaxID=171969 RepID=A0A9Q1QB35_9CARY|nr:hypothetical protein Cgig2_032141 [Carnegiea gigantea]